MFDMNNITFLQFGGKIVGHTSFGASRRLPQDIHIYVTGLNYFDNSTVLPSPGHSFIVLYKTRAKKQKFIFGMLHGRNLIQIVLFKCTAHRK